MIYPGSEVTANCTTSAYSFTISGPAGSSENWSLTIKSFNSSSEGNYACVSSSQCEETVTLRMISK